jgi:hypothetical protein
MHFNGLSLSNKIAMLNVTVALWTKGIVEVDPNCLDQEEIIDALVSDFPPKYISPASLSPSP